jgi:molecular chaperone DnaK (HSP70)
MKKKSRFIIGIDLGTTNSALAYIDTHQGKNAKIERVNIPQLVSEGAVKKLPTLPSFYYIPGEYEVPEESMRLPWAPQMSYIVGEFARIQGSRVPARLVSSAKSWLCHNLVDRKAPILPWSTDEKTLTQRISPVEASASYLKHIKDAWNHLIAINKEENTLENQHVIITIPASFDESARELTSEAAQMAGINSFSMLEEPQAAFYCWLFYHEKNWQNFLHEGEVILIFDIGGGTTDFNLITVKSSDEKLIFERVAVGEHLMLGGDNMDLSLARDMETKILGKAKKLDFQRWLSLSHQCRMAKEELLSGSDSENISISILGTGKSVIGGSLKKELTKDEVEQNILNGFFKNVSITDEIAHDKRAGFQELGLPFVTDPVVLKHLSSFLKKHALNPLLKENLALIDGQAFVRPDALLFNGGVFKSPVVRKRTTDIVSQWFHKNLEGIKVLENDLLEHAVSMGAAYYGMVQRGRGIRISGGSGRAYYIAAEGIAPQDEDEDTLTTVCIVPRGLEEGEEIDLQKPQFHVMTNKPVSFPLFSSSYRIGDKPGALVTAQKDSFTDLPPIKTVLHFGKKTGSVKIPVSIGARLTEFGTLDVWCASKTTSHRWKLAFDIRKGEEEQKITDSHTLEDTVIDEACRLIEKTFKGQAKDQPPITPENIMKKLTKLFELDKSQWPLSAIRKMWDTLLLFQEARLRTAEHESRWFNLAGFLLRPGFGYPLDDWRIKELWKIFHKGVSCTRNTQCRVEWWVLWRRVAGGLNKGQSEQLFNTIAPWLLPSRKKRGAPSLHQAEVTEMWMLAAGLENLSVRIKIELGTQIMKNLKKDKGQALSKDFWALSRIGARVPFHGPIDRVIPQSTMDLWINEIISMPWRNPKDTVYALAQMARKTDDRTRDIDESLRARLIKELSAYEWSAPYIRQLQEHVPLKWEDEKNIFGESLPVGLFIDISQAEV